MSRDTGDRMRSVLTIARKATEVMLEDSGFADSRLVLILLTPENKGLLDVRCASKEAGFHAAQSLRKCADAIEHYWEKTQQEVSH